MNRIDRRKMKERAIRRLKSTGGYILVTFDGKTEPVYQFDLEKFDDRGDLRHATLRNVADNVARALDNLHEYGKTRVKELEQGLRVQQAREKRSAKLAEFNDDEDPGIPGGRTFQNAEVKVDAAA